MNQKGRVAGLMLAVLLIAGLIYVGLKNNIFADVDTPATNIYVSTSGSDSNDGSINSPFKTLTKARDYTRTLKPLTAPVVINLRAGTYDPTYFTDSASQSYFSLGPADSGTANFPITYQAYNNEQVVLSGGQKVTGWQKYNDKVFVADAPSGTPANLNSLYVSGESAQRARISSSYLPAETAQSTVNCANYPNKPNCNDRNSLRIYSSLVSPNWTNLSDVELVVFNSFKNPRLRIDSIFPSTDGMTDVFTKTDADVGLNSIVTPGRFYFDNVFEALDSPGEWYFNKNENKIYYYPKSDEDINSLEIIAPKLSMIMSVFQGSKNNDWSQDDNLVHDLNFKDLTFSYTNYVLGNDNDPNNLPRYNGAGHGYSVGYDTTKAAVRVFGTNRVNFSNNTFAHLGNFGFDSYAKNLVFSNNKVFDVGSGGIKIGSRVTMGWPKYNLSDNKVEVISNEIHDTGKVFKDADAIYWVPSGNDAISSNLIYNSTYRGLSIYEGESGNNLVSKNQIHDVMQELNDGGAIYAVSRAPVVIENNWVHDIKQVTGAQYRNWGINGIYLDEASEKQTVRNNLIESVSYGAIALNRSNNNVITNNIIAGNGEANIFLSKFWTTESTIPAGNQIDKNIIITKSDKRTVCLYGSTDCNLGSSKNPLDPRELVQSTIKISSNNYFYNMSGSSDQSLTAWKSYGFDVNSLFGQDPFINFSAGNYCLKNDSQASSLGIESIDLTSFGKTACATSSPSPSPTSTQTIGPLNISPTPTPTSTTSSPPNPSIPTTSYTFPKGFSTLGVTKSIPSSLITSNVGLYVYKFDGANNKWLMAPTDSFTLEPSKGYYIYNSSGSKTISLPYATSTSPTYNLTSGWNLLYTSSNHNLNTLALSFAGTTQNAQMRINSNTIYPNIFIIDNPSSTQACSYFKILGSSDNPPDCSNSRLGVTNQIPSGKSFWVYVR